MLHIFLVILKIIGIILIVLFTVILVLTLLVLFVPVCYRINCKLYEDEKENASEYRFESFGAVSFLGFLVRAEYEYQEQLKYKLKLCGITIMSDENDNNPNEEEILDEEFDEELEENDVEFTKRTKSKELKKITNDSNVKQNVSDGTECDKFEEAVTDEKEQEIEISHKRKKNYRKKRIKRQTLRERMLNFWKKVITSLKKIIKIFTETKQKIEVIKELLENDRFRQSFKFIFDKIKSFLHKIAPSVKSGHLVFGTEDVAKTGEILGFLCAVKGMSGVKIDFLPDFESERFYIHGDIVMKGRISMIHFVKLAYYYFFNKNVKYFKYMIEKTRRNL